MEPDFYPIEEGKEEEITPQYLSDLLGKQELLSKPILNYPYLRGSRINIGKENNVFRFEEDKGLWLGNAQFENAPFRVDMEGNLVLTKGNITFDSAGFIRGGQSAYDTGTGFFLGYSGNAYKFSIGNSAGNKLTWDGSTLTIKGKLIAELGSDIKADYITAGTLTGITIQTATTGKRLRMQGVPANEYQFLDNETKVGHLKIDDDGYGGYYAEIFIDQLGATLTVGSVMGASQTVFFEAPFISTSGKASYGQAKFMGNNAEAGLEWSGGGDATWSFNLGSVLARISSNIEPISNYDLGSSSYKWRNLYLSGNIYVNGTVDGVDISAHAANASAHHSATSSGIDIVPASISTTGYAYLGSTYTYSIIPRSSNSYDLGSSSYYWYNLYLNYLRFNSSYGRIYWGTDLVMDIYNAEVIFRKHFRPPSSTGYNLGTSGAKWEYIYSAHVLQSCPLPTQNSAIATFKKIKSPKIIKSQHYGERWHFEDEDFPEEMKCKDDSGKKVFEHFRGLGITIQAIRELILKVEALEEKYEELSKKIIA